MKPHRFRDPVRRACAYRRDALPWPGQLSGNFLLTRCRIPVRACVRNTNAPTETSLCDAKQRQTRGGEVFRNERAGRFGIVRRSYSSGPTEFSRRRPGTRVRSENRNGGYRFYGHENERNGTERPTRRGGADRNTPVFVARH